MSYVILTYTTLSEQQLEEMCRNVTQVSVFQHCYVYVGVDTSSKHLHCFIMHFNTVTLEKLIMITFCCDVREDIFSSVFISKCLY